MAEMAAGRGKPLADLPDAPTARQGHVLAIVHLLAAAILLLGSFCFQLSASNTRWLDHAQGAAGYRIDDNRFDYYLNTNPAIFLPGTHLPFGVGLLLQAAGLAFLVAALFVLRPRPSLAVRRTVLLLATVAVAWYAFAGAYSVYTGLSGLLYDGFFLDWLVTLLMFLSSPALLVLGILAWRRMPAIGMALLFLTSTGPESYLFIAPIIAAVITGYDAVDAVPGAETVMAVGTAMASATALLAAAQLIRRSRKARGKSDE